MYSLVRKSNFSKAQGLRETGPSTSMITAVDGSVGLPGLLVTPVACGTSIDMLSIQYDAMACVLVGVGVVPYLHSVSLATQSAETGATGRRIVTAASVRHSAAFLNTVDLSRKQQDRTSFQLARSINTQLARRFGGISRI